MELKTMIAAMTEVNLCSYFLLPLLGLSSESFGEGNFINSYLSKDKKLLYVHFHNLDYVPAIAKEGRSLAVTASGQQYLIFAFSDMWQKDVELFSQGKYSKMTEEAKNTIRTYSGLYYKENVDGVPSTDFRLIALTRNEVLIEEWKSHLYDPNEYCILDTDPTTELLEAPKESTYFNEEVITYKTL